MLRMFILALMLLTTPAVAQEVPIISYNHGVFLLAWQRGDGPAATQLVLTCGAAVHIIAVTTPEVTVEVPLSKVIEPGPYSCTLIARNEEADSEPLVGSAFRAVLIDHDIVTARPIRVDRRKSDSPGVDFFTVNRGAGIRINGVLVE